MGDDAMRRWMREVGDPAPPALVPDPEPAPRVRPALLVVPVAIGLLGTIAILLLQGFPPRVVPPAPAYVAVPLLAVAAAVATGRRLATTALWAGLSSLTGALVVTVVTPVWFTLKALECVLSWLSSC